ncbi:MAG: DUF3786 domain-containing protein [Desulfatibacillum sp.]|nr:DUF3786 domain-containing protein [Desulfatibacillum sp.]
MLTPKPAGGYQQIYDDLLEQLRHADINASAQNLGLALNASGEIIVPFLGATYLLSTTGVRREDGKGFHNVTGSGLIHYVINASATRPVGRFVTFAELAGPLFGQGSFSRDALERPIVRRFQGRVPELMDRAAALGGRPGGEGGMGSVSLIIDLLPHMPMQLVFYDRDQDYPARAILLFDPNAARMVEFEVMAVLSTQFVRKLTAPQA